MRNVSIWKRSVVGLWCLMTVCGLWSQNTQVQVNTPTQQVTVEFYAPEIVRVVKQPFGANKPEKKSFSVILTPDKKLGRQISKEDNGTTLTLSSDKMTVTLDKLTGQLTFANATGEVLLREKGSSMSVRENEGDAGKLRVGQTWTLDADEAIFGLGQLRDTAMNWRGHDMILWNHNGYIAIPYITSEKGYGLYWDNPGRSRFTDDPEGMTLSSEVAEAADYYFMYRDGTQDGVIAAIRQLTGQATMFPLWTLGHWQCRERYKTSDELCDVLDRYRELEIPLDGIVQDWQYWGCDSNWNAMRFQNPYYINKIGDPEWARFLPKDLEAMAEEYVKSGREPRIKSPEAMVEYVHQHHAHLMISIWASFGPWTEGYAQLKEIGALMPLRHLPAQQGCVGLRPLQPQSPRNLLGTIDEPL